MLGAKKAFYARLNDPAIAHAKESNFFNARSLPSKHQHTPRPQTALPTWDEAAAAVFSESSSGSNDMTETHSYDSNADFLPSNYRPLQLRQHHSPQTPRTPNTSTPQRQATKNNASDNAIDNNTNNNTTNTISTITNNNTTTNNNKNNNNNNNNSDLWAQSLPSHMMPTPSPSTTTTKANHSLILNDSDSEHLKKHKNPMNDTLNVSMLDPNFSAFTNTNLKCPILYNKSQPDIMLTSLQNIQLSPILSSSTKSLLQQQKQHQHQQQLSTPEDKKKHN